MALTLGFIGIVTSDMAASLTFYRALGITIPTGSDDAPHVEATLDDGIVIAWDSVDVIRGFDAGYTIPTGGHRIALAFAMSSPGQVDRVYRDLVAAGHHGHVEPWDAHYATLHDPDGNSIDLYAWLPTT